MRVESFRQLCLTFLLYQSSGSLPATRGEGENSYPSLVRQACKCPCHGKHQNLDTQGMSQNGFDPGRIGSRMWRLPEECRISMTAGFHWSSSPTTARISIWSLLWFLLENPGKNILGIFSQVSMCRCILSGGTRADHEPFVQAVPWEQRQECGCTSPSL